MHPLRVFSRKQRARPRRRIRKLRLLALLTVLLIVGSVSFSFGMIRAVAAEIDAGKLDPQRQLDKQVNGYIYDKDGKRILAVLRGSEARTLISYDQIADPMRHAIVAIEDRRFWEHDGIDLRGIGRALLADIRSKASSRAARRSRSSSSRTRSTATRRRSPARCARPPTRGSSSATPAAGRSRRSCRST